MKKGITVAMLVVIVSVIGILTTATVKSISSSYTNAKLSVWITEVGLVQDLINENKNNISDMLLDEVIWDVSKIDNEDRLEQINGEIITDDKIKLKEINLAALGVDNAIHGIEPNKLDVYAYSETTGKVYYLKGIKVGTRRYYTLTSDLKNRYGDNLTTNNLSLITFEQSEIKDTTNAIKVTVKVPKAYTNVSITTSNNNIQISAMEAKDNKNIYTVNTNEIKANYDITVTYTENGTVKSVKQSVKNYVITLGSLITAMDYGKTVDYVSDNGVTDWKVFYEDETNGYVYLIASEKLAYDKVPATLNTIAGATISSKKITLGDGTQRTVGQVYWPSELIKDGTIQNSTMWMANWLDYKTNLNAKLAGHLLDETHWMAFKNTSDSYKDYVLGAIGTPTAEMFVASWNAKRAATNDTTTYNKKLQLKEKEPIGYYINDITAEETASSNEYYQNISTGDNLYIWSTISNSSVWLASPSAGSVEEVIFASNSGRMNVNTYDSTNCGLRPVVCLNANIPAKIGTTTNFSIN